VAKAPAHLRSLARAHTVAAVNRIAGLAEKAQSESVRLDANKALLDRGWGAPTTKLGGGEDGSGPLEFIVRQIMEGSKPPKK